MSPHEDGFHAGMRTEHYECYKGKFECPPCPYDEVTERDLYDEWQQGFDDATEYLCVWQYLED